MNPRRTWQRVAGDKSAIAATLLDATGAAVDLTNRSIVCRVLGYDPDNEATLDVVHVADQAATLDNAAAGQVSYTPAAGELNAAGCYAVYFLEIIAGAVVDRWPGDGPRWVLRLVEE